MTTIELPNTHEKVVIRKSPMEFCPYALQCNRFDYAEEIESGEISEECASWMASVVVNFSDLRMSKFKKISEQEGSVKDLVYILQSIIRIHKSQEPKPKEEFASKEVKFTEEKNLFATHYE